MNDGSLKELEKRYFLISKPRFVGLVILFAATLATTWLLILTGSRPEVYTSIVGGAKNTSIHFCKTFTFWVPEFKPEDSAKEEAFNTLLVKNYKGLSRWPAEGYYEGERQTYVREKGWNYQVSLTKETAGETSVQSIRAILKEYFDKEESFYITEIIHNRSRNYLK